MKKQYFWQGLGYAGGVVAYASLVAWGLSYAGRWFAPEDSYWSPVLFLSLLCFSAALVGLLIFGRPVYLALSGDKQGAFWQVAFSVGWLFILTVLGFVLLAQLK